MSSSGMQCQIKTRESDELEKKLLDGSCDFAFIRDVDPALPLVSIPFTEDYMKAVVPEGHRIAGRGQLSIRELRHEKFLLHPEGSRPYKNILALCRRENFEPDVVYTDSHMRNICCMVASGMGVSLLNEHLICNDVPGICAVPIDPPLTSRISLCYSSELDLRPRQRDFLSCYKGGQWK